MNHELQWDLGVGRRQSEGYIAFSNKLKENKCHMIGCTELGQSFAESWVCPDKKIGFILMDFLLDGADVFAQVAPHSRKIKQVESELDKLFK